ncbi:DUF3034 family protein [Methyloversatilis sp. XJ19-49]|uniref:DUF3034 family protein n=1 Tax=Methyloversatilis sp. XJ19-49 TaxID=2963429 RepID=UPI00211C95AF|nr:DUF3034 family protein [Methyloversatilis sp. XJ19-49]MCQ9378143.1 DUF3034 family protein [Methyloversatilis sp. XJ19-49]
MTLSRFLLSALAMLPLLSGESHALAADEAAPWLKLSPRLASLDPLPVSVGIDLPTTASGEAATDARVKPTAPGGLRLGDRLIATGGVTQIEGAAGGGLNPWAVIAGYGTREQIGATAFRTRVRTRGDFELESTGVAVGFYNRVELSAAAQRFDLSDTVPGESINVDVIGAKVRLFGDAVYDQDRWWPQVSVGLSWKHNSDFGLVPSLLGAKRRSDIEGYVAATKVYLGLAAGFNVLTNVTLQATRANQFGILGFGGDRSDSYKLMPGASVAVLLRDNLALGAEYRDKPNNLSAFREDAATDVFLAWFPFKSFSLTAARVDLGNVANKPNQRGWYFSGQLAF